MKRALCGILSLLFFASCAGISARVSGRPVGRVESASPALRHEVFESLKARNDSLRSLRGMATVRYGSSLFGIRGETSFAVSRPERLRIDGLSDFGAYTSQFVLRDGDLTILWPADGSYYQGKADRDAMNRYLRVDVSPEEAVNILMGLVPLEEEEGYVVRELHAGHQVLLRDRAGEVVAERKEGGYVPVRYTAMDEKGRRDYVIDYSNYRTTDEEDRMLAGRIEARFFGPKSRIQVDYQNVDVNPKIEGRVFQIEIPPDATRIQDE